MAAPRAGPAGLREDAGRRAARTALRGAVPRALASRRPSGRPLGCARHGRSNPPAGRADAGVAIVTLAPELPGALDVIRALVDRGVVVSAGHTGATAAQAEAGIDAGVRWVTHLFNAMAAVAPPRARTGRRRPLRRSGPGRPDRRRGAPPPDRGRSRRRGRRVAAHAGHRCHCRPRGAAGPGPPRRPRGGGRGAAASPSTTAPWPAATSRSIGPCATSSTRPGGPTSTPWGRPAWPRPSSSVCGTRGASS